VNLQGEERKERGNSSDNNSFIKPQHMFFWDGKGHHEKLNDTMKKKY
jgi:hypothetical protein